MVGKISPLFLWWGSIPFLGTPKTPLLWCRVCRGSCYDRAIFNNLQQAVFSLFAHSSKIDRQANPNQGQSHLAIHPNQGHPTDGQSLEDRKKNLVQSPLHHRFNLFPTCSRFRLFFDSFSGFARGSFVVQLPFATPKTLICAATKWKRTSQADLSICH